MTYLIVDTNNWIYLASSKNPDNDTFEDWKHMKLYDTLAGKITDQEIKLLVCDIIIDEWRRNKGETEGLVKKLNNEIVSSKAVINKVARPLQQEDRLLLRTLFEPYKTKVLDKIQENKNHIAKVEALLTKAEKYAISGEIKVFAADWALSKKAPFIGDKKNSMADALIFFGAVEYLKKKIAGLHPFDDFIFVSGNKGDFSSPADENIIHEDLSPTALTIDLKFFRSLPAALNFIEKAIKDRPPLFTDVEIAEMEADINDASDDWYICDVCSPGEENEYSNLVYFSAPHKIEELDKYDIDPNQMRINFAEIGVEDQSEAIVVEIQTGECSYCGTTHLKCSCGDVTPIEGHNKDGFVCEGCGIKYILKAKFEGSPATDIFYSSEEENEE